MTKCAVCPCGNIHTRIGCNWRREFSHKNQTYVSYIPIKVASNVAFCEVCTKKIFEIIYGKKWMTRRPNEVGKCDLCKSLFFYRESMLFKFNNEEISAYYYFIKKGKDKEKLDLCMSCASKKIKEMIDGFDLIKKEYRTMDDFHKIRKDNEEFRKLHFRNENGD